MLLGCTLAALGLAALTALLMLSKARRKTPSYLLCGLFPALLSVWMVSVVVWNTYFFSIKIPGLFDISIERVLFLLLCVLAFYQVATRKIQFPQGHHIELLMALFLLLCIVSMSIHGFGSKYPHTPKAWYVFFMGYFEPFMAFVFIRYFFTNASSIKFLMTTLFVMGVYLCITAILEKYGVDSLIFPAYIADKTILLHLDRARGPFLNAAFNGLAMTVCFVAGLFLLPLVSPLRRVLLLALFPLFPIGVFFTATRSAYLVFLLALGTLLFFYRSKTPTWKITPLLLTLCLIAVVANSGRLFSENRAAGGIAQVMEVNIRFELIAKSLRLIQEAPVFGIGLARFSVTDAPSVFQDNQHNHLIGMAAELGLLGLLSYLCLLVAIFRGLYRLADDSRVVNNAWANFVILLTLGVTAPLVNNIFVEPSLCPFINVATFSFGGMAALLQDHPGVLDTAL